MTAKKKSTARNAKSKHKSESKSSEADQQPDVNVNEETKAANNNVDMID